MSDIVAPALSTYQTDELFQKYDEQVHVRSYLNNTSAGNIDQQLAEYYSVKEIIEFLSQHPEYSRITLQFPDHLVMDSAYVLRVLQNHFQQIEDNKRQFWILADTSYSSCCVDEVAAEHVKGDVIVHFGDACLNSIQKLPVVYSFGKPQLPSNIVQNFMSAFPNKEEKVCLVGDSSYNYSLSKLLHELLENGYKNVVYTDIPHDIVPESSCIINQNQEHIFPRTSTRIGKNRVVHSEHEISLEEFQQEYSLFHITIPQDPHLLFLTTLFNNIVLYDPVNGEIVTGPFPSMMKRYKFMHVARTAGTIGVLVNTLSLKNTKETINALNKLIKENDKKSYLFVVGKPNVAKLANFESIDIWCILGCSQSGIIIDQYNEFYKPIITPYELQLSLQYDVTWTGKWVTQFGDILKQLKDNDVEEESTGNNSDSKMSEEDDDEPVFSAVTGSYVSTSKPLRQVEHLELEAPSETPSSNSLVKKFSGQLTIKNTVSTSAAVLQNRMWTGLGSDFRDNDEDVEEEGATLQHGISGVARGYKYDRENAGL